MNPQSLLVSTDLSESSRHTAQRAAMLAQQIGSSLDFIHVLDQNEINELIRLLGEKGELWQEKIRSQTKEKLSQLTEDIRKKYGVSAKYHIAEGKILDCINEQADAIKASLLVVGAHGTGILRQQLLGATAERLQRLNRCPVLTVKQPPRTQYQNILIPIDFSPWSLSALNLAQEIAPKAKYILLHVYEAPFESKMRIAGENEEEIMSYREKVRQEAVIHLQKIATEKGISTDNWRHIIVHGNTIERILEHEIEQGADLIVLGKHGLGIGVGVVEEFLIGSNTRQILIRAHCDVLVVPYR